MKIAILMMSFAIVVLFALSTAVAQPAFEFPQDPDVPVLKVEEYFQAGRDKSTPMILVYADGRVVKPVSDNPEDNYEITIDENRLNELLREIIDDNAFLEMNAEDIKNEVLTPRKMARLRPGFEFKIELNLADQTHTVSIGHTWVYQRLSRGRTRHEDAEVFQRFLNVEELCRKLSNWSLVGGENAMQTIMETANKKTQEQFPGAPEISEANMLSLKPHDGGRVVMYLGLKSTEQTPPLHVIVGKSKGEEDLDVEVKINRPVEIHCGGNGQGGAPVPVG